MNHCRRTISLRDAEVLDRVNGPADEPESAFLIQYEKADHEKVYATVIVAWGREDALNKFHRANPGCEVISCD